MRPVVRLLLPALAAGILLGTSAQAQVRPRRHAVSHGRGIQGTVHLSHPVAPHPYFKPVRPVTPPGILPAYVTPPSAFGPPVTGYGTYPNVRYFRRHGHVYAHDFTTGETYLVQW